MLTFGEFAGTDPFVRVSVYRHGSEKSADAAFFVDMARRAAQLGLSLGRADFAEAQATRLGDVETAALTMTEGRVTRENCRGFRFSAAQLGLTVAGFACGAGQEAVSGGDLACLLDRLDLVSAGEDRALRDFFAAAQARGARGCADSASSPAKKRANEPRGCKKTAPADFFNFARQIAITARRKALNWRQHQEPIMRRQSLIVLALMSGALVCASVQAEAKQKTRQPASQVVTDANAAELTVQKKSWLEPSNVVPVGTQDRYAQTVKYPYHPRAGRNLSQRQFRRLAPAAMVRRRAGLPALKSSSARALAPK